MTFADDFALEGGLGEQPEYPTLFGVSVSPTVGGVVCAVAGLIGAGVLGWYVVKPAWENLQTKQTELTDLQVKIDGLQAAQQEIKQLAAEQQKLEGQKREILSLFAAEDKLDTYLYDLGSQVQERQGELVRFEPKADPQGAVGQPTVVADGSWGAAADGLLKTKAFNVSVEGTFDQTQSIIRSIEALQLLSVVKNFDSQVTEEQILLYDPAKAQFAPLAKPKLTTIFTLETLVPLSAKELEEAAKAKQAAAQPPADGTQPSPAQ
jgi:type IV pilus assembly protein PilO